MLTREQLINHALEVLRVFVSRSEGVAFTADFFGAHCFDGLNLPEPTDYRLLGAVFQRAKREGLIKQVFDQQLGPLRIGTRSKHKSPLWIAA